MHKLRKILDDLSLDAILFTHPPNIRYFCGFTGSEGVLVVDLTATFFLTDSRYTQQARGEVFSDNIREYKVREDEIQSLLKERPARRVGFEADFLAFGKVRKLEEKTAGEVEWVPLGAEIRSLRGEKNIQEIDKIRHAAGLNFSAFEEVLPLIKPGKSEREVALALEFALKKLGGEEKAFDFIVASGFRGALPHGIASEKKICFGELVTIDFGIRWEGYHSDETITVAVGQVPDKLEAVFDTVLAAHDRAIEKIRPGMSLREIDGFARQYIVDNGFGDYFGHGLGHGVGLEVHEYPVLSPRSEDVAVEGMVVTVEPGVYIPEVGGVRIEDMILITSDGCEVLTRIPKNMRILSL
ncbi:MAG: aminopeptidase P family protein [Deltaproteobacteria bacterium]|nr:aminopeptidase P family protein [Deltaproteobacteria bacterium]